MKDFQKLLGINGEELENYLKSVNFPRTGTLKELLANHNPLAYDLVSKMLVIDPENRISVEEALAHPFLAEFHEPHDEPVTQKMNRYDFDFEFYNLSAEQLKDLMYEEIMLYYDENSLRRYLKDKINHPEGSTGIRFGLQKIHS